MVSNKEFPLVSIVIPSYNHEKYIVETILSVLNQTYKTIELIVIDDGSKDNSAQVIQDLAKHHKFFFILRENKGLSATLNEGIRIAKGKYFCACASDDILMLDKIEKQVKFMEANSEYGMCYGKIIYLENSKQRIDEYAYSPKYGWIFDVLLNDGCFIPAPSVLIRKEVFQKIGNYDESLLIEDWDMWLRIAYYYPIGFLNDYLAYYRKHETNISKQIFNMYEAEKKILSKYSDYGNYEMIINKKKIEWFSLLSRKYKKEALKYLLHAFKHIFTDLRVTKGLIKLVFFHTFKRKIDT